MERVYATSDRTVEHVGRVAVAVYRDGNHIGLIYRSAPLQYQTSQGVQPLSFLHLGFHERPLDDFELSGCALWIDPALEPETADLVAANCRLVQRSNARNGLAYGFSSPLGAFTPTGAPSSTAPGWGLTCASFVLAIFDRSGIPLIRYETWPIRDEDREWQKKMIALLESRGATPAHIDALRTNIGQVRYRVLEVAGAASASEPPIDFATATGLSKEVAAEIHKLN